MRGLNANTGQLDCYTNAAKDHGGAFCLGQASDDCARLHTYEALQTQAWALQGHAASVNTIALNIALATGSQLQPCKEGRAWTCIGRKSQQGKMLSERLPCGECTLARIVHTATLSAPRTAVVGTSTALLTPCTTVLRLITCYWDTGAQSGVAEWGRGMCWWCCRHSCRWMPRQSGASQRATQWCSTPSSSCRRVTHFRMPATDMKA